MKPLFKSIWTWAKRGALFAGTVWVAYIMAMQFPQYGDIGGWRQQTQHASPLVFASMLTADLAFLYFWFREDARK